MSLINGRREFSAISKVLSLLEKEVGPKEEYCIPELVEVLVKKFQDKKSALYNANFYDKMFLNYRNAILKNPIPVAKTGAVKKEAKEGQSELEKLIADAVAKAVKSLKK